MNPLDTVRRLFTAIERVDLPALADLYADDVVQFEPPNRLLPAGATRGKAQILEAARRGRALMSEQRFDITQAVVEGPSVALQARWMGRLAVDAPALQLAAGDCMTAHFAQFVEVRDGRVVRHTTYDCFDPWESRRDAPAGVAPKAPA